jgi:hypothetical protein
MFSPNSEKVPRESIHLIENVWSVWRPSLPLTALFFYAGHSWSVETGGIFSRARSRSASFASEQSFASLVLQFSGSC